MSDQLNKYAPLVGLIPGTKVNLGGRIYVMPPLSLDQVQEFEEVIKTFGTKPTLRDNMEIALPVLLVALQRNYADMTIEDLRPLMDMGNSTSTIDALWTSSGFVPIKPGEPEPAAL